MYDRGESRIVVRRKLTDPSRPLGLRVYLRVGAADEPETGWRMPLHAELLIGRPRIRCASFRPLHLSKAPVDEQLRARDIAAVVGSEKYDCLRNLARRSEPAKRNGTGNHFRALLAGL